MRLLRSTHSADFRLFFMYYLFLFQSSSSVIQLFSFIIELNIDPVCLYFRCWSSHEMRYMPSAVGRQPWRKSRAWEGEAHRSAAATDTSVARRRCSALLTRPTALSPYGSCSIAAGPTTTPQYSGAHQPHPLSDLVIRRQRLQIEKRNEVHFNEIWLWLIYVTNLITLEKELVMQIHENSTTIYAFGIMSLMLFQTYKAWKTD